MSFTVGGVGGALAFSSASGGKVYGYNNIKEAALTVVAPANPSRQKIRFHNPGGSDIFIAPANVQNVLGTVPTQPSNVALVPSNAALGGCIRVFGNGGTLDITGECQGAWQAFAITGAGTTNALTVIDSNT
jgi:hypothetical protein